MYFFIPEIHLFQKLFRFFTGLLDVLKVAMGCSRNYVKVLHGDRSAPSEQTYAAILALFCLRQILRNEPETGTREVHCDESGIR